MSEAVSIDTLEMVLNEQAEKDTSLRVDGEIILNGGLLDDFNALQREKRELIASVKDSMGGIDTSELDAKIAAVQAEAENFVVRLHFQAISGDQYLRVVARHPNAKSGLDPENTADWQAFLIDLADECYIGFTFRGTKFTKTDKPLVFWRNHRAVNWGQLDPIFSDVLGLNRREPDRSFLSKR